MRGHQGLFMCFLVGAMAIGGCGRFRGPDDPTDLDPGAVEFDGNLSNRFVPAEEPTALKARLVISSRNLSLERRPPINLALIVDTSGSMEGAPIEDARAASLALLEMLSPGDRLSVVTFNSSTEVLIPSTELDDDEFEELREQINGMTAVGTTDLAGGLRSGLEQVMANHDPNGINRVVLVSDGVPNDPSSIEGLASAAGQRGVSIISLGLGLDYDELLLGRIAQLSGGRFHYIEESSRVATVFQDEVLRLQRIVARNATLTIQPGPGVSVESVIGQQPNRTGRGVQVSLGELTESEDREIVVQLAVPPRRTGASVELFDAVLTFDDALDGAGRLERRMFLGARSTDDVELLASGRNDEVEQAAARLQAAVATVEAIQLAREGEAEEALERLDEGVARLQAARADADGSVDMETDFALADDSLEELRGAIPDIARHGRNRRRSRPGRAMSGVAPASAPMAAPAPVEAERIVREAHEDAMETLLDQ